MEIVWPALGIGLIVVFVLYVLAQHWEKVLQTQAWSVRRLAERVRHLEHFAESELRRMEEPAPVPLEQVFVFFFQLGERFWRDTMHAAEENLKFIRGSGVFAGSVRLERWRSHTVATITEVLPNGKGNGWGVRSVDFYPDPVKTGDSATLWELPLERPGASGAHPPSLELVLYGNRLELRARFLRGAAENGGNGNGSSAPAGESLLLRVPLDPNRLAKYRSDDPAAGAEQGNAEAVASANSWHTFYAGREEDLDIEWQLRLRDLIKKAEWERWKMLESAAMPLAAGRD